MGIQSNRIFLPGNRFLIAYLVFLGAFPPLTTDMYLPALPLLAQNLGVTDELASLSLTLFFFGYALSTLFWGPCSDRYGRRPILLAGSAIYILASIGIALAGTIWTLLWLRCLQALGCGAATAMSLAIVKDVLRGGRMEKIVSYMQAAHVLAPLSAPVIGGLILYFVSWRGVFWCLAGLGAAALAGALCLRETGRNAAAQSLIFTFRRIGVVLANKTFRRPFLIFSAMTMPFMSYLAVSAFVYQNWFGLSPQQFSFFFAINAGVSLLAPLSHIYFFSRLERYRVIGWQLLLTTLFGMLIVAFGKLNPWLFALLMAPVTFCGSAMRPSATFIMMQAVKGDNGIVASLIQFGAMMFASIAMLLAPMSFWPTPVMAIGTIAAAVSGICLFFWLVPAVAK